MGTVVASVDVFALHSKVRSAYQQVIPVISSCMNLIGTADARRASRTRVHILEDAALAFVLLSLCFFIHLQPLPDRFSSSNMATPTLAHFKLPEIQNEPNVRTLP